MDEEVRYQFTGDLSNLRDSVQNAIGLLDRYAQQFRRTDRVTTQASRQQTARRSFQDLRNSLENLGRSFKDNNKHVKSFALSVDSLTGKTRLLGRALGAVTAIKVGDWLAKSVKESISYIENLNLFRVAMGESVEEGLKFVNTMSEIYGMDPSNLYRYTGYFYELTDAIGMADDASATLSLSLTKASNDIASLFNVPIEQVVNNLASGMQGMSRAVRKYGMDIRANSLQQTAYAYGLTEQVSKMSEADRMALRYLTMMHQVRDATQQVVDTTEQASGVMGDFARNIETPANQLRIFKEQITQLGRAIGNFFVPALRAVLPVLNGIIMALRTILTFIGTLTGLDFNFGGVSAGADDLQTYGDAIADAGEEAEEAGKKIKKLQNTVLGFDELNLLNAPTESTTPSSSSSSDMSDVDISSALNPVLADAIQNLKLDLEDVQMKANKVRDAILEFLGFKYDDNGSIKWFADQFEENLIKKFPQWELTIRALFDNWSAIMQGFRSVFHAIGLVVDEVAERMRAFLDSLHLDEVFAAAIEALPGHLQRLSDWIEQHVGSLATFVTTLGELFLAFKVLSGVYNFIEPIVALAPGVATFTASLFDLIAPLIAIGTTVALLYTNSEDFAEAFKRLFRTIVESFDPIASSVETVVSDIWHSLKSLWDNHLQPMIKSVGDLAASILDTITAFWAEFTGAFQSAAGYTNSIWSDSILPIIEDVIDTIGVLAVTLRSVWQTSISPTLESLFGSMTSLVDRTQSALASILHTLGLFVQAAGSILQQIVEGIGRVWSRTIAPLIKSVKAAIEGVASLVLSLWNNFIGPVLNNIIVSMPRLWAAIQPVVENVIAIVGSLIELILALWTNILSPLLTWLVDHFGPKVAGAFKTLWNVFVTTFEDIMRIIEGVLGAFRGLIEFLVGVFTGDWDRAFKGLAEVTVSVMNTMIGAIEFGINAVISVINMVISSVFYRIQDFVNSILDTISSVADFVGWSFSISWTSAPPELDKITLPKFALATGGVVTGPTQALIGEGRYDEAVIPLGNSPQMRDFADSVADRINTEEQVSLLREQNALLRQILEKTGTGLSIRDLTRAVTQEQRLDARARGSI